MSMFLASGFSLEKAEKEKDYDGRLCTESDFKALQIKYPQAETSFDQCSVLDINIATLTMKFHHQLHNIHYADWPVSTAQIYTPDITEVNEASQQAQRYQLNLEEIVAKQLEVEKQLKMKSDGVPALSVEEFFRSIDVLPVK